MSTVEQEETAFDSGEASNNPNEKLVEIIDQYLENIKETSRVKGIPFYENDTGIEEYRDVIRNLPTEVANLLLEPESDNPEFQTGRQNKLYETTLNIIRGRISVNSQNEDHVVYPVDDPRNSRGYAKPPDTMIVNSNANPSTSKFNLYPNGFWTITVKKGGSI